MSTLATFQESFARALFGGGGPLADEQAARWATQPAFAVYRNTVMKGCIDALQANHPAVLRLVGETWFRSAAAIHVRAAPPKDPRLLHYGVLPGTPSAPSFADFLSSFEPADQLPYLPDVARLDGAWTACHAAPDAPAADPAVLAALELQVLGALHLRPHPAARWMWFEASPIYTIWSASRQGEELDDALAWQGEGALLTRPLDTVQWCPIGQAGCALLDACADGATLAEAAESALRADPACDLAALLALLLQQGAFLQPLPKETTP
jgi:hypothetical protein